MLEGRRAFSGGLGRYTNTGCSRPYGVSQEGSRPRPPRPRPPPLHYCCCFCCLACQQQNLSIGISIGSLSVCFTRFFCVFELFGYFGARILVSTALEPTSVLDRRFMDNEIIVLLASQRYQDTHATVSKQFKNTKKASETHKDPMEMPIGKFRC